MDLIIRMQSLIRRRTEFLSFQLCLSGWVGVLLTTCCRYHYPGTKQDGCVFPVKSYHIVSTATFLTSNFDPRCLSIIHLNNIEQSLYKIGIIRTEHSVLGTLLWYIVI